MGLISVTSVIRARVAGYRWSIGVTGRPARRDPRSRAHPTALRPRGPTPTAAPNATPPATPTASPPATEPRPGRIHANMPTVPMCELLTMVLAGFYTPEMFINEAAGDRGWSY